MKVKRHLKDSAPSSFTVEQSIRWICIGSEKGDGYVGVASSRKLQALSADAAL